MPAFYSASIEEFLQLSHSELMGLLTLAYAQSGFVSQRTSQTRTWFEDLGRLHNSLNDLLRARPSATGWTVILEFEIPRKEKRIDVVILASDVIVILELKSGIGTIDDLRQAEDYALLLHYFHRPSNHRKLVPLVVTPENPPVSSSRQLFLPIAEAAAFWISPVQRIAWAQLAARLAAVECHPQREPLDAAHWLGGEYHPVPTIIDAARELESGLRTIREIAHSRAAQHDVDELSRFVEHLIETSKTKRLHTICFITGVPGSGKTLVGLHLALSSSTSIEPMHFMSGTGPLVKVLQAALARNHRSRTGLRASAAEMYAKTLIENVHVFAREYSENDTQRPPNNHVIIFDEAQRAWDAKQNLSKFKRAYSEPQMLLDIMERHDDWSVVIALVGGGQEINSGEAGLSEWGRTLQEARKKQWQIYASPEAVEGGAAVAGTKLFSENRPVSVHIKSELHLDVSVRNLKAASYAEWVHHVVNGDSASAVKLDAHKTFPILLTRSLSECRILLRENTRGESRCGLVASSKAVRLRAEGLEPDRNFHAEYPWDHWYLAPAKDTRSSYQLEVFTTEFEIQGLELDWIGLCWGGDFIWSPSSGVWLPREFRLQTSRWSEMKTEEHRNFRRNSYRVLLTRARQGIVIFVPPGDTNDPTRSPREFDETAMFLEACGAQIVKGEDGGTLGA